MEALPVTTFDVDLETSRNAAGAMEQQTRRFGLSLGDRILPGAGRRERLPALTTDRVWSQAGPCLVSRSG